MTVESLLVVSDEASTPDGAAPIHPASTPSPAAIGPWVWLAAVMLVALAGVAGLALAVDTPDLYAVLDRPGRGAAARRLLLACFAAVAALSAVVAAAAVAVRVRRGAGALRTASAAFLVRLSAYLAALVLVAMHFADPVGRLVEWPAVAAALGTGAWVAALLLLAALLLARPRCLAAPTRRRARAADTVAFNVLVVALALEAALAVLPRVSDSPLLHFDPVFGPADTRHADNMLRRFRLRPHVQYFDGAANSRGYIDDEFFVAGPGDLVVAVIADSFGVGVVAPRHNFVAELERTLQAALAGRYRRVAAHNFGVSAAGFPEYRRILETEALATRPSVVVLCIFVGNDLYRPLRVPGPASFAVVRSWRTYQIGVRLGRLARERGLWALARAPQPEGRLPASGTLVDDTALPTRPRPLFLDIERQRLEACNSAGRRAEFEHRAARQSLAEFRRLAGDRLLVVLIPDEYQVDDALWDELLALTKNPGEYDRTYPQRRLLAACRDLDIAAVDLLPVLAEAQQRDRTYRLNDTHWSRLGNAVAGRTIADAILRSRGP